MIRRGAPIRPYLEVPPATIAATPWLEPGGGSAAALVENWDPETRFALHQILRIDARAAFEAAGLAEDAAIRLIGTWSCPETGLRGAGNVAEVTAADGLCERRMTVSPDPDMLAGRVSLTTMAVLAKRGARPSSPLAASEVGAVLHTLVPTEFLLEPDHARFPITAVDFARVPGVSRDALWHLDWTPDHLDRPAATAVQLLVNAANGQLMHLLRTGSDDSRHASAMSVIHHDVTSTMLHEVLQRDDFVEQIETFDDTSVGGMLRMLLAQLWPEHEVAALAARRRHAPGAFRSDIQALIPPLDVTG